MYVLQKISLEKMASRMLADNGGNDFPGDAIIS
jgi:hypothetical protein